MATKLQPNETPGGADLAQHPTLWGHPLPRWTDTGVVYAHGSHWTPETDSALSTWLGDALQAIRVWIHGPERHRSHLIEVTRIRKAWAQARDEGQTGAAATSARAQAILDGDRHAEPPAPPLGLSQGHLDAIEDLVQRAERSRQYLWNLASASDPKTRPGTMSELAQWTTKHRPDLVLRLSTVGLVPKPPASIIPKDMPKHGPSRQAKLDAKPSADPAGEDIF